MWNGVCVLTPGKFSSASSGFSLANAWLFGHGCQLYRPSAFIPIAANLSLQAFATSFFTRPLAAPHLSPLLSSCGQRAFVIVSRAFDAVHISFRYVEGIGFKGMAPLVLVHASSILSQVSSFYLRLLPGLILAGGIPQRSQLTANSLQARRPRTAHPRPTLFKPHQPSFSDFITHRGNPLRPRPVSLDQE